MLCISSMLHTAFENPEPEKNCQRRTQNQNPHRQIQQNSSRIPTKMAHSNLVADLVPQDLANEVVQAQDKHPKGYDKDNGVKMPWLPGSQMFAPHLPMSTYVKFMKFHEILKINPNFKILRGMIASLFSACHLCHICFLSQEAFQRLWGSRGSSTMREIHAGSLIPEHQKPPRSWHPK